MKLVSILSIVLFLLAPIIGNTCSVYKVTKNGKTIVGNNEDWFSPNSKFWFESGQEDKYGVMYMGQLDDFAQGAINEAGLVFDGFWEPYLAVKNTDGKLEIPIGDVLKKVMQTMDKVEEVQLYLQTINLNSLTDGQLVFVDKSGTYLIVEGDEMFIGEESEKSFSNFYYSQIDSIEEVSLNYFQSGQTFLNSTKEEGSLDYCSAAMKEFSQSRISPTQYSTIYDLSTLKIRVYLYHDFAQFIELDLKEELRKGNHFTMIAELFSKESIGYKHYKKFNNPEHPTLFLEEYLGDQETSEQEFIAYGFDNVISALGNEWLTSIKNPVGAINVFQYGVTIMPHHATLYDGLGEAHFANNDWNNAIINYAKSLSFDPENKNAIQMILKIDKLKEEKDE